MAHVGRLPIGHALTARDNAGDLSAHQKKTQELLARRAEAHAGWGERYIDRVREKNKLATRERIEKLKDAGTPVFEVGTLVNYLEDFGGQKSPAAGVITLFARVQERWCVVIANDNTVASGAWWPRTPEKIQRAQEIALRLRLPTIYLVDCSGLYLPEQRKSFAGAHGAGHIFKMNSLLSAHGVPQIAGVFGDCIAGGGYMPIISDRVYMTENAYMVIAGAALIKGAKSEHITSLDIGGAQVHVHESGCADVRVPDDLTLIECIRRDVAHLPSSAVAYYRQGTESIAPRFSASELPALIPTNHRLGYEAMEVLARICDLSLFQEFLPQFGQEIVCGIAKIGGLYAGVVINQQGLIAHADRPEEKRPAGILYRDGIIKMSAFSRACNDDGIPLIWLQDVSGFDIGLEAERQGLLGLGSNLIYTNSTNTTPMFTVLLRKASGAGFYAMAGLPYDPIVQLSTTLSRLSVMEGKTAAIAAYHSRLDDNFEIASTDAAERAKVQAGMQEVEARIERDMDPYVAANQMDTDEVIALEELRDWLVLFMEISYQATGHRRVKNPRIWSLHDLQRIGQQTALTRATPENNLQVPMSSKVQKASVTSASKGATVFCAPMGGRFYWKPAPDAAAFIKIGDTLEQGDPVGMIEVMKSFHRVNYEGASLPANAGVKKLLVSDGVEVEAGQALIELGTAEKKGS